MVHSGRVILCILLSHAVVPLCSVPRVCVAATLAAKFCCSASLVASGGEGK